MSAATNPQANTSPINWIVQHWRGDLSLGISYWLTGFVVGLTAKGIGSSTEYLLTNSAPRDALIGLGLLSLWITLMTGWYLVGVWRSASRHTSRGGKRFWALTAKAVVLFSAAVTIWTLATSTLPQFRSLASVEQDTDRLPAYSLRLSQDHTAVSFAGGIRAGATDKLAALLDATPSVKRVYLSSSDGWLVEATKMRDLFQRRKLTTAVAGDCLGACTVAYLGGVDRILNPDKGRLGFTAWDIEPQQLHNLIEQEMRQAILRGVALDFIRKAYVPDRQAPWLPTPQQLLDARYVTRLSNETFL